MPKPGNLQEKSKNKQAKLLTEYIQILFPFTKIIFNKFPWITQFINFSMVGVINMILSYFIYAVLIYFDVHYQIANQASFWISVLNGYVLNKFWVFKGQISKKESTQSIKYVSVYGFNMILGILLMYVYVDVMHLNEYIVPFISMPLTIPLNYCLNKFWVFKKEKTSGNVVK